MQHFLFKLYSIFVDFISVSNIKRILLKLKGYWQVADVSGRMLIMVFFAPSLLVLFWLLAEIAYLVVFELPLIIIKIIAKVFLFCIFWSAAVYFYEKLYCIMSEKSAGAEQTGGTQNAENSEKSNEPETHNKLRWRRKI